MEIDITEFFKTEAPMDFSASVAEIGANAGPDTWRAANESAADYAGLLDTEEKRDAFRDHVKDFGAWDANEIAVWTDTELTALFVQMIAGDMREVPDVDMGPDMSEGDWRTYEKFAEQGVCAGRIFKGDDGRVYYYIGC